MAFPTYDMEQDEPSWWHSLKSKLESGLNFMFGASVSVLRNDIEGIQDLVGLLLCPFPTLYDTYTESVDDAREAGINVQANVHAYNDILPEQYIERFPTKKGVPVTWGDAISLRVGKQKAFFRNGNPFGAFGMDTIK